MELQNVQRLAVFKMRNIGDVLVITPALRALRETFPNARITVVVNSGTEAMLTGNPHIDDVLIYNSAARSFLPIQRIRYELQFLRELRRKRFDLTIGFTDGDRAAWSAFFSGARYRLGTPHYSWDRFDPRRMLVNLPTPPSAPPMHEVERHFWLLDQGGIKVSSPTPGPLCLEVSPDLRAWAKEEMTSLRPARIVHVHPVARWLWKCWRNDAMAKIIDWLQTKEDARVVVTTGPTPRERERAQEIVGLCRTQPRFYNGNLSLSQTAALSAEADVYFGVDTAPMHMAAAVGTPVLALFGPTSTQSWGPWTGQKIVLSKPCPCELTKTRACDWNEVRTCLASITVSEVQTALDQLLAAARASRS